MAAFNLMDMLGGGVTRREAPQQDAALGQLLGFLSQSGQQQAAPVQEQGGRPVDTSLIQMLMGMREKEKEQSYADEGAALRQSLMGTPGEERVPTPLLGAHDATPGTGYLGGKLTPQQVMAGLLGSRDKTTAGWGAQMVNDQWAPRTPVQPHYGTMGVPGKEGWITNYVMTSEGPQAVGEPWKQGSGVTINTGEGDLPKAPSGYMYNETKNRLMPIPGGPGDQTLKPLTDAEGKSQSYTTRMQDAHDVLKNLETTIDSTPLSLKQWGETVPGVGPALGAFGNKQLNSGQQSIDQAQRQFINALLRHESGATINPDEFINYSKQYFKSYGDSPEMIAQKRKAREEAILGMDAQSGAASPNWKNKVKGTDPRSSESITKPKSDVPSGWSDELEAEYQRSLRGQ